ncbi:MAG: uncharacterized protein QOF42_722 [Gammaproteobacteria bacterium]|jgi:uncharacterized protein YciI|nr:uncharacterized protein [Gammaproteobacteria bacterium]
MHFVLFYEFVPDYLERRAPFRAEHLRLAWEAQARGQFVLGGPLADPVDGAIIVFECDSRSIPERFAQEDPYVKAGLVTRWRVREWNTVVGQEAANPVRSV